MFITIFSKHGCDTHLYQRNVCKHANCICDDKYIIFYVNNGIVSSSFTLFEWLC